MDMEFKGVRWERECGAESIELVCWGVVGEGAEEEIYTCQGHGLLEERGESQIETENRHGGERNAEDVREGFVERFLETVNMLGGVEDRKIYESVDGDSGLP